MESYGDKNFLMEVDECFLRPKDFSLKPQVRKQRQPCAKFTLFFDWLLAHFFLPDLNHVVFEVLTLLPP